MNKNLIGGIITIVAVIALVVSVVIAQDNGDSATTSKTSQGSSSDNAAGDAPGSGTDTPAMNDDPISPYAPTNPSGNASSPAAANAVTIDGMQFSPSAIKIKKGTTITWTNKDSVAHTVTGLDSAGPKSPPLNSGDSYSYTFKQAGTFGYKCTFHPDMKGQVIVE